MNYNTVVNNVLAGMKLSRELTEIELENLNNRFKIINDMVVYANGGEKEANLRSTQVISYIMFEYFREIGIGFNE